ncbi:NAD(P)-dependent dehydrogenase (short-subunit alcohol dehydrogenase family) [Bradyrhizobium sp. i1.8.4]|uniref:SDR family NAD(P)-dependent oxidoreductase n=1 Tax=unclassified Bradyrhizobium TaxID=2631580 RepID=UPI003D1CD0E4
MTLRLDNRVAIVTGAGTGLGREHALLLAARGAKLVVNDPGRALDGRESDQTVADQVVAEIRRQGGVAVANYDSVADPQAAKRIVDTAITAFGRLDILVNNAGILRDKSFGKMALDDYRKVIDVHLMGSVYCTHAAWPVMTQQKYGRVVMTTSTAGTNGSFGQTNYGAAKMALIGLMNCLATEGRKNNVLVNAVSPGAVTRMTEALTPEGLAKYQGPELVSPAVGWLASERCTETALILWASAGHYARFQIFQTEGVQFDPAKPITVEMFDEAFPRIADLATATPSRLGFGFNANAAERLKAIGRL